MEINHQKSKSQRKDKCNKEVFEIADHKLEIRRTGGIWQKRKIIYGRTDEIDILIQYFKDTETESIEQGFNRNAIIDLWIKCLIKLNNRNILF